MKWQSNFSTACRISLREKSGTLAAEVDGNILYDPSDRVQFVSRRLGADTVIDFPFGDSARCFWYTPQIGVVEETRSEQRTEQRQEATTT
jgi:hypothetical protein